ncbi:MAG: tyrosine-protein phosphatase [Candidatus Omnitrophota bacterium]
MSRFGISKSAAGPALALFILLGGCVGASAAQADYDVEVSLPREIFNFHVVAPGLMRGSQPSEAAIKTLRDHCGVRTVLSLRQDRGSIQWEQKIVEALGMTYISVPMDSGQRQPVDKIEGCLRILRDPSRQPVFVHCQQGKDRTGMVIAAYRMQVQNWSFEDALSEMHVYGYSRSCCSALEQSLLEWTRRDANQFSPRQNP